MQESNNNGQDKNNSTLYIVIAVVAVLVIGGIVFATTMNNDDKKASDSSSSMMKKEESDKMMKTESDKMMMKKEESDKMMKKEESDKMAKSSSSTSKAPVNVGGVAMVADKNIIQNVVNAPNLTTLVTAVTAADLVTTLSGPGPFTVFGPTNTAFEKLPAGTVTTLLKPESKADLTGILTYHVVAGYYDSASLTDGLKLKTVQGSELTVKKTGGKVMIMGGTGENIATVETADVFQSNGVAHVIDSVLLPPAK